VATLVGHADRRSFRVVAEGATMTEVRVKEELRVLQNRAKRRLMAIENALAVWDFADFAKLCEEGSNLLEQMMKRANHERLRAIAEDAGWNAGMEELKADAERGDDDTP